MNDAPLPKPTPPQQTTLKPDTPVSPAAKPAAPAPAPAPASAPAAPTVTPPTTSAATPGITTPPAASLPKTPQAGASAPPPGVPTPMTKSAPVVVSPEPATKVASAPTPQASTPVAAPAPTPAAPPAPTPAVVATTALAKTAAPAPATSPVVAAPAVKPPQPTQPPQAVVPPVRPPMGKPPTAAVAAPAAPVAPVAAAPTGPAKPGAGTPPPGSPPAGAPKTVAVSKSPLRFLPFVVIGLVLVAIIGFVLMRVFGTGSNSADTTGSQQGTNGTRQAVPSKQVTLKYWGLWEPSAVLAEVFQEYEKQNPGVKVEYTQQSHQDYRERLQTAVASGQGPDLFRYHASWAPMLRAELSPVPSSVISAAEFKTIYYPVANKLLQLNGQIVGVPLMYDGLALLYNKEIFENSGDVPPKTWAELRSLAAKLTSRPNGVVMRGGVALGGTANVQNFSDILGLLMLQNGADPKKPNSPETRDALLFYSKFLSTDVVWSDALPNSSVAFARGDVAMIFAPSWRIHEILATNPNIKIGVAPLPKLSDERLAWATFWAEGISAKSQNKEEAAKLLKYLSSPEVLKKMYASASKVRAFGEIYPRVDMANELASDPYVGPYLADAPYANSWYMSSYTHDKGVNDQIIKYYEDAINAVNTGKPVDDILKTVDQGVTQVLRQYSAP